MFSSVNVRFFAVSAGGSGFKVNEGPTRGNRASHISIHEDQQLGHMVVLSAKMLGLHLAPQLQVPSCGGFGISTMVVGGVVGFSWPQLKHSL